MKKLTSFLSPGAVPFSFAAVLIVFTAFYRLFDLPSAIELGELFRVMYQDYGRPVVLLAAFIEGIFMINIYFPGSFVILLAVFAARHSLEDLILLSVLCWAGFTLAGGINYWLGKVGFYRILLRLGKRDVVTRMQSWMDKHGRSALFIAAIHPNFLAVSQVCMGIGAEGIGKTLLSTAFALIFWVPLWTAVFALLLGSVNLNDNNQAWYIIVLLLVWGAVLVIKHRIRHRGLGL